MFAAIFVGALAAVPIFWPNVAPEGAAASISPLMYQQEETSCRADTPDSPAWSGPEESPDAIDASGSAEAATALPVRAMPLLPVNVKSPAEPKGVQWRRLARDSMAFLTVMHSFRWAKEAGTRAGGIGLGESYTRAVGNLHGWADGDEFYVNYIGHPMQGAVSGRLYLLNDPRFNKTEFGQDPDYWKGKLRAAAFAWALSEEFEIGPLSEASIGHIQKDFPQQGFVDHVVTPAVGLGWMIGEDAIDRYIIRRLEDRTANRWLRIALRSGLNPTRSFANALDGRRPWDRGSRPGVMEYRPAPKDTRTTAGSSGSSEVPELKAAPFEFSMTSGFRQFAGGPCMGGGADVAFRVLRQLQLALTVNGCKLLGLETNLSGDALFYQFGPRWTPQPTGKWSPYAHVLFGGLKVTHEQLYPALKAVVLEANKDLDPMLAYTLHDMYTKQEESSGVAVTLGTGLDYKLSAAVALRVASVEYQQSSVGKVGGLSYSNGLQVTTGLVLRLGTW